MGDGDTLRPTTRREKLLLLAIAAAVLLLIGIRTASAGTWLDEYWQLWISNAPRSDLGARLIADTHPPWFNLFARAIVTISGGSLPVARLLSLALAVALLGVGLHRLTGPDRGFTLITGLFIVAIGGQTSMLENASTFRVYPWLIVLAALQGVLLAQLARGRLLARDRGFAAVITFAAIVLHYVASVAAIAIALVTIACALRRKDRAMAITMAAALASGVVVQLVTGLLQLQHWRLNIDYSWIAAEGLSSGSVLTTLIKSWVLFNLPAVAILLVTAVRRQIDGATAWLLAPIPLAAAIWLIMGMFTPILVPRYALAVPVLLNLAAAGAVGAILTSTTARVAIATLLLANLLANHLLYPPIVGWEGGARQIAALVQRCPGTQVFAASHWRFGEGRDSRTAAFEAPVIQSAYTAIGQRFGFEPTYMRLDERIALNPTDCGAVLWVEHAHGLSNFPAKSVLAAAGITIPPVAAAAISEGENGAVVRVAPSTSSNFDEQPGKGSP